MKILVNGVPGRRVPMPGNIVMGIGTGMLASAEVENDHFVQQLIAAGDLVIAAPVPAQVPASVSAQVPAPVSAPAPLPVIDKQTASVAAQQKDD